MGSHVPHVLPIEQGRFVRPSLPHHLCRCNLCSTQAVYDELHNKLDCSNLRAIRAQCSNLFQMLRAVCICSYGTKSKRLSAIASPVLEPFCKWPRQEHRFVLMRLMIIGQAGWMDVVKFLSLPSGGMGEPHCAAFDWPSQMHHSLP